MTTPEAREYVELVARIHEVYRHLEMDTPEDRAIHARHIENADRALELARRSLAPRKPNRPSPRPSGEITHWGPGGGEPWTIPQQKPTASPQPATNKENS